MIQLTCDELIFSLYWIRMVNMNLITKLLIGLGSTGVVATAVVTPTVLLLNKDNADDVDVIERRVELVPDSYESLKTNWGFSQNSKTQVWQGDGNDIFQNVKEQIRTLFESIAPESTYDNPPQWFKDAFKELKGEELVSIKQTNDLDTTLCMLYTIDYNFLGYSVKSINWSQNNDEGQFVDLGIMRYTFEKNENIQEINGENLKPIFSEENKDEYSFNASCKELDDILWEVASDWNPEIYPPRD